MKKPTPRKNITDLCKKLREDLDAWETIPSPKTSEEPARKRQKLYTEIKKQIETLDE
jgi:hypothetical protein